MKHGETLVYQTNNRINCRPRCNGTFKIYNLLGLFKPKHTQNRQYGFKISDLEVYRDTFRDVGVGPQLFQHFQKHA